MVFLLIQCFSPTAQLPLINILLFYDGKMPSRVNACVPLDSQVQNGQSESKFNVGILFQTHVLTGYISMREKYLLTVLVLIVLADYFMEDHFS